MIKIKKPIARKGSKKKSIGPATNIKLKDHIVNGMQEKKAKEIVCIDFAGTKSSVADFFVICHADSRTHVESIAASIEDYVHKMTGENPFHKEGFTNAEWILLDYVHVVAHVFLHEQRKFYGIERLWADAEIQQVAENF
jgi:ribosome-associated protein